MKEIHTLYRALQLTAWCRRMGWNITHPYQDTIIAHRYVGDVYVATRIYAEVWKGHRLVMRITVENPVKEPLR